MDFIVKISLVFVAISLSLSGGAQATEFITNGTFNDDPTVFRSIQSGWEIIGGNNIFFVSNSFFNGSAGTWGTLSQNINGALGALNLSFNFSTVSSYPNTSSYQKTYFNGIQINEISGPRDLTAGHYSVMVYGTGNDNLSFVGRHGAGYNILSNVSLVSAVPEPKGYAMMLIGLGVIGSITRLGRKSRNA